MMKASKFLLTPQPLYLGSPSHARFAWYHPPRGPWRSTGVVLCNPIGDDAIRAHRTLRHAAERLADAGFAVLRFDFFGTGDSMGDERSPDLVDAWLEDLDLAIAELKRASGAEQIALLGIRLGATLAMTQAARRGDVASLVLWNPYPDGESFVLESTRLHRMHTLLEPDSFSGGPESNDGKEALGFLLTPSTIGDLGGIDLSSVSRRPAERALVIGAANVPAEGELLDHLRNLRTDIAYRHLPGHRFLIATPHESQVPDEVLAAITRWLGDAHPPVATSPRSSPPSVVVGSDEPLTFGTKHPLFGIYTPGAAGGAANSDTPFVVLTNAGTVHRIGPHRLYVGLARRLANAGLPVLRLDLSGIGDSLAAGTDVENLCYPKSALFDLKEAMDALEARFGARRFVIAGLCSGGDLAFQLGQKDPRVRGAILMNPRTFCVHDLELVDAYEHARYYQGSLRRLGSWKKLLRGDVDLYRAARLMLPRIPELARARLGALVELLSRRKAAVNDVPAALQKMADSGVETLLLATENDPGVAYVDAHFGRAMRALDQVAGFRREYVRGTDHTFTARWAQAHVQDLVADHLAKAAPAEPRRAAS
jgi:dienelactone hydrolase